MKRPLLPGILAISMMASTGCTSMTGDATIMSKTAEMFHLTPSAKDTDTDDQVDESWGNMIKEGRPESAQEMDPDRFWFEKVMSPQARSIENNLGFK